MTDSTEVPQRIDILGKPYTVQVVVRDDDDPRLMHVCFDVEQGADYLTWLRGRKS